MIMNESPSGSIEASGKGPMNYSKGKQLFLSHWACRREAEVRGDII